MATNKSSSKKSEFTPANAFLNLFIVDKNGVEHRIKAVVGLYEGNKIHEALMTKAGQDKFELRGEVRMNSNTDDSVVIEL